MKSIKSLVLALLGAILLIPQWANAQDGSCTGPTCATTADLNLSVIIPTFLYFRVGTAAAATVDTVTFNFTTEVVGDANNVPGDAGVTVTARSNGGVVTIATTTDTGGGLGPGAAQVTWDDFTTTSSDAANFPAPVLLDAAVADVNVAVTAGSITNRTATWTYDYDNVAVYAAGTYTGTVTYSASIP